MITNMSDSSRDIFNEVSKEKNTWLVTGSAGFIANHLCERLLECSQKVIAIDNFSTGLKENIAYLNKQSKSLPGQFDFQEGDIRDHSFCEKVTRGVDFVLHQAAIGSVPRSIEDPLLSHSANVDGFLKILVAAKDAKVRKFVYASSSSVYGDHPELPKKEQAIGSPLSPYAATKYIDEIYADVFLRNYQMPTVGLRYFNVFGPRQNPAGPYAAVIPLWIKNMVNDEPAYINGDGSYSRDFCFIENVVEANLKAAFSSESSNGRVFNIALGKKTTLLELYELIRGNLKECGFERNIPEPTFRDFRDGDIPHSLADISLARKNLDYDPKIHVSEGLRTTVKYFFDKYQGEK